MRLILVCGSVLAIAAAGPSLALECPRPQPLARPGVLKETPAEVSKLSAVLAAGHDEAKIQDIVSGLRLEHPGVEPAEIMNFLITAYCPVAAQAKGLTEAGRQTMVDQFVIDARGVVYAAAANPG